MGRPALTIDFDAGLIIERAVHAIARSAHEGGRGGLMAPILGLAPAQQPIREPESILSGRRLSPIDVKRTLWKARALMEGRAQRCEPKRANALAPAKLSIKT